MYVCVCVCTREYTSLRVQKRVVDTAELEYKRL